MFVVNSELHEWNEHPITQALKKVLREEIASLEDGVMGGDCANNHNIYIASVSEYKVLKSLVEDSFLKAKETNDEDYQR